MPATNRLRHVAQWQNSPLNLSEFAAVHESAYGDAETKRKALENGAEALLTKPIDFGALRSEIETRVKRTA